MHGRYLLMSCELRKKETVFWSGSLHLGRRINSIRVELSNCQFCRNHASAKLQGCSVPDSPIIKKNKGTAAVSYYSVMHFAAYVFTVSSSAFILARYMTMSLFITPIDELVDVQLSKYYWKFFVCQTIWTHTTFIPLCFPRKPLSSVNHQRAFTINNFAKCS